MKTLPSYDLQNSLAATLGMGLPTEIAFDTARSLSNAGVGYDVLFSHREGVPW